VALLAVAAVRRTVGLRRWPSLLGRPCPPAEAGSLVSTPASGTDAEVGRALARASARLPYRPTCLDRAMAGRLMLRRRGRTGAVVVGLAPARSWAAHAWLVGPTGVVVGADEAGSYAPATIFR
jgi:hypothetical protein